MSLSSGSGDVIVITLIRLQYIEQEMSKRKGVQKDEDDISS